MDRRTALRIGAASMTIPVAALLSPGCTQSPQGGRRDASDGLETEPTGDNQLSHNGGLVKIHFLEIVTPDVDGACALYATMYGVTFGDADQNLGGARTADLDGGGMLGIRAPLRDTETPVVRPYVLVDDISAAVSAAAEAGAEIAITPTEIADYGQFAIVIHGGIESGLWQI
jgi:predicted enzyme related to lactoylglutathione lyase